jgi:CDP-glucose 4,6-dehydratase
VLGGGDWAGDRIVPDAVRAILSGKPLVVRRPLAVRPWQHVLEPLSGYLTLAERLHADPQRWSSAWNFGPSDDDTVPVKELLDRFFAHWGDGGWEPEAGVAGPHEAGLLRLDCSKARTQLGWRMALGLDQTVAMTADWYRRATADRKLDQADRSRSASKDDRPVIDLRQLTLEQIDRYEQSAGIRPPQHSLVNRAAQRLAA